MNNLNILMKYEWKKLLQKRRVRVAVMLVILLQVLSNLSFLMLSYSDYHVDKFGNVIEQDYESGYERMVRDRKNAKALDGRAIDNQLFEEFRIFGRDFDESGDDRRYIEIYMLVRDVLEDAMKIQNSDADEFYREWKEKTGQRLRDFPLYEGEKAYWDKKTDNLEIPLAYQYAFSWDNILGQSVQTGFMVLMLVAVCLSGMFADEHQLKTDQMVLCMKNGRTGAYFAKAGVGALFGAGSALLLYGITFLICFGIYGTDGFGAALRLKLVFTPFDISLGESCLIMLGLTVAAGILESAFAMYLSERLNNSVAVMAVIVGIMLLAQFAAVPVRWRVLSQVVDFLPTNMIQAWRFLDGRLVHIAGIYLTNFQFAALLYPALAVVFVWLGKRSYQKFQVTGR